MLELLLFGCLIACTGKPVSADCPANPELSPPSVEVRYGDSFTANCTSPRGLSQTDGMGWESQHGGIPLTSGVTFLTLKVDHVKVWKINAQCYINFKDGNQCNKVLPVTVYKTPDSVSVSPQSVMDPMVETKIYLMQCDIVNVAPAKHLSVHWYKGNKLFYTETFDEPSLVPVNKSSVAKLIAHRDDNGTEVWCEAKLNFLPTGPDLPTMRSKSREVIVLYPPTFNVPANETVAASADGKSILNCTAKGNPPPKYSWHVPQAIQHVNKQLKENHLILTKSLQFPGTYSCTASNSLGNKIKFFTVTEEPGNRTTFWTIVGVLLLLGGLLAILGLYFLTPNGTFSFIKGSYTRGQPTSSGPV